MHLVSRIRFAFILLALATTLAAPCLAQSCVSQLDELEKILVGNTSPHLPVTARVDALERGLFGNARTGSMAERLRAIQQILVGSVGATGSPAVAGAPNARTSPVVSAPVSRPISTPITTPIPVSTAVSTPVASKGTMQPIGNTMQPIGNTMQPIGKPTMVQASRATPIIIDGSNSADERSAESTKEFLKQALMAHSKGDLSEATRLFEQVLSLDPKNTDANYNLGSMSEDRGNLDAALQYYRNAAASSPEDNDIRTALASVERRLSKRQASGQNAELQELAKSAGAALRQGDYTGAIPKLEVLAQKAPSDASIQFGLSRAWYGKGNLGRSRQYLQGAIALAPDQQMYKSSLQVLDREIQKRQNESSGLGHSDASEFTTPSRATMNDDSPPAANSTAGGIVPYTDRGAPMPAPVAAVGSVSPAAPVGVPRTVLPVYATQPYAVNPFDQAILESITGMAALSNASRGYPVYTPYTPYTPYAPARMRVGRTGSLTAGLLGLLGVGY